VTSGATDPALSSPAALREAVTAIPSRSSVEAWLVAWPLLDEAFGDGHAEALESALFSLAQEDGKPGFRAIWVLALLSERGVLKPQDAPARLMALLDRAEDTSRQREMLRALLHLDLPHDVLSELVEWASQVVFLAGLPAAMYHMALRVLDKALSSAAPLPVQDVHAALLQVKSDDHPAHLKKKAAQLMARLS